MQMKNLNYFSRLQNQKGVRGPYPDLRLVLPPPLLSSPFQASSTFLHDPRLLIIKVVKIINI